MTTPGVGEGLRLFAAFEEKAAGLRQKTP